MSGIHQEPISLEELIERSPIIVQAVFRANPRLEPKDGLSFEIEALLGPGAGDLVPGDRIQVWSASAEAWGYIRWEWEQTGMNEWLKVPAYSQEGRSFHENQLQLDRSYILFLKPGIKEPEYVMTAEGSFLDPASFDGMREVSASFTWTGGAAPSESGPVMLGHGREIRLEGLTAWPRRAIGKTVKATGLLVKEAVVSPPGGAGEASAGEKSASNMSWVLKRPRWKVE